MKLPLLDIVNDVLSDMTSDPVNSISDTFESQQVAKLVRSTFIDLHNERVWPHTGSLFKLTASADSTKPTHMRMEDDVDSIEWVKYNCTGLGETKLDYRTIVYKRPEDFIDLVMSRNTDDPNVDVVIDYHGTPLFILTNEAPTYYTSFDDKYLVFDSYDSAVDDTMVSSKTQVFGFKAPSFTMEDSFVPDMPSKAFSLLVNEVKSRAFIKLKEVFSQKDEQASVRQRGWLSREKRRINGGIKYPDYGRKSTSNGRYSRAGYRNNQFTG